MRIATYNVEWFSSLFDEEDQVLDNQSWSSRRDVTKSQQLHAVARVFKTMDADAVMIIEAPDSHSNRDGEAALENFAHRFGLRTTKAIIGFVNDTQQEIALLYDPTKITVRHDPLGDLTGKKGGRDAPRFDGVFRLDLDIDADEDLIRFSKPPLELSIETENGSMLRMIGAHLKSKAPHGVKNADPDEIMRVSIANRRKQLAQCIWLRQRVETHLDAGDDLIVLGDFNDGPGLDEYEKLFGRSGVEIVLGAEEAAERRLFDPHAHAALSQKIGARVTTARFYVHSDKRYLNALLDYVMVSPALMAKRPVWHVLHPFDDPKCWGDPQLCDALLTASDHFPVMIDIDL